MNVFILDVNPVKAAQMQCDKHVVKMVLESTQILSTIAGGPYKPTHQNHPCVVWARACITNYSWLVRHARALCAEYSHRYGKTHKCQAVIESIAPPHLPVGITEVVQCMPEQYKGADPVQAYRAYYMGDKAAFARWTKREVPYWWKPETKEQK